MTVQVEPPSTSLLLASSLSLMLAYCKYEMEIYLSTTVLTIPLLLHLFLLIISSTLSLYSLDTESFSGHADKTHPLL